VAYLAVGVVIALVKMSGTCVCPDYYGPSGYTTFDDSCRPIASAGERLRFIGWVTPTWPYLVVQEGVGPRPHPWLGQCHDLSMRRKIFIGLGAYLALGVVFGLVTDRHNYMCPGPRDGETLEGVALPDDRTLVEAPSRSCLPVINAGERVRWVAVTTPAWLPLVIRNVVRSEPIQIGGVCLGH